MDRAAWLARGTALVVEDDPAFASMLRVVLNAIGLSSRWARNGAEAWSLLNTFCPILILLDLSLPDTIGERFVTSLRSKQDHTPLIVVTGSNDLQRSAALLRTGADDYITKPFTLDDFEARITAVLRRATAPSRLVRLNGRFTIDPATHCVSIDGQALVLSPREFGVMWVLAVNHGHHLATDDLSQRVLSGTADRARSEIHVLISTLRAKLRLAGNIVWIETIARKGYALRCRDHRHPNP